MRGRGHLRRRYGTWRADAGKRLYQTCNTYFANLAVKIGGQRLLQEASKFGFNKEMEFSDINLYRSNFEVSRKKATWPGPASGSITI